MLSRQAAPRHPAEAVAGALIGLQAGAVTGPGSTHVADNDSYFAPRRRFSRVTPGTVLEVGSRTR